MDVGLSMWLCYLGNGGVVEIDASQHGNKTSKPNFLRKMTAFLAQDLSCLFPEMINLCFVSHECRSESNASY